VNQVQAHGWLLISAINHLYAIGEQGCCPKCCGTCSALVWYSQHPQVADRLTEEADPEPSAWITDGGTIDWGGLAIAWNVPCPFGDNHEQD
jgi:hypothetical protein